MVRQGRKVSSIAEAAMCGASEVLGLDIDCEAIRSARRSWSLNESNGDFHLRDVKAEFLQVPRDPEEALQVVSSHAKDKFGL